MISVSQLVKRYGRTTAVDGVSFEVARGEVVGFLGPNGAGKTTTLRILAGFLGMTSGRVRVAGHDVIEEPDAARRALGYMPEASPLYGEMRVAEYLSFRAELKGVRRAHRRARVGEAMERAHVATHAATLIAHLSKGYRQRVGLADALVARPSILILDEPTAGLDPNQIREVRALVRDLAEAHTVLLSTHILSEVEASCARVLVLARGRLVASGTTGEVRALARPTALAVTLRDAPSPEALARLLRIDGVVSADVQPRAPARAPSAPTANVRCAFAPRLDDEARARATENTVAQLVPCGVQEVRAVGGTLEEVFAELTANEVSA